MKPERPSTRDAWRRALALWLLVTTSIVVAATPQRLSGSWRTQPITVDGLTGDWPPLTSLERGPQIGAVNDGEFLHLAVSTRDPDLLGLLASGLIVWIDLTGRRSQTFGLRMAGIQVRSSDSEAPRVPAPGTFATRSLDRFDILGPGENQRRLVDLTPELDIELAQAYSDSEVIYELKMPLQKTAARLYAVGAPPGRPIGLGIATPEAAKSMGLPPRLVGGDGFIGGHPFRGGGFASFREPDGEVKPLQVWTTLVLAPQP